MAIGLRAVALLVVAVSLAACAPVAGGDSAGTGPLIALLLPESKTARYGSHDRPAFEQRVGALCPSCRTLYQNANQDALRQQAQAEAALTNGAAVLVLDPVDSVAASVIVRHADGMGVPVVTYDRLVLDAPVRFHVTFDNERVGELQAQALVDVVTERARAGRLVAVHGAPTDHNARLFKDGARRVLDASGMDVGAEFDVPDWSPDKAQELMEQALATLGHDGIAGVYVANDGMAAGVIAAMKAAGIPTLPPVTGQDAELAAVRRLLTGEQYMTVYKRVHLQARVAAEVAVALATDGAVPSGAATTLVDNRAGMVPTHVLEPLAVTREEIAATLVADRFWSVEEICDGLRAACAEAGIR